MSDRALGRGFDALELAIERLAGRKGRAIVLAGIMSLLGRAILLPVLPIPKPAIQDEFSYLLAGDTFAAGRLSNRTPPFPQHFETLQVLMHPTYASRYPPLSGLMMALGQRIAGQAWVGVWLSSGIMCAVLCWCLQGWLPPVWAFAGSLLAVARIGIVSYWTEGYWGGACAALGGALLIGALPRLIPEQRPGNALAFAAGLAILANTRPYEGLVLGIVCSAWLCFTLARRRLSNGFLFRKIVLPVFSILIPIFVWMSYYNYRVTGNAVEIPYVAYDKQYVVDSPLFLQAQPSSNPVYGNAVVRDFWTVAAVREYQFARDHWVKAHVSDMITLGHFFLGWPLVICTFASARWLWRDHAARHALLLAAGFYSGAVWDARLLPHYAAPATALAYILAACSLRAVRTSWPGGPAERRYITCGALGLFALTTGLGLFTPENRYLFGSVDYHVKAKHVSVQKQLEAEPGEHLVLVHYGPRHDPYEELVFNRSDIQNSRVVWAHSLDPESNSRLIQYFSGRRIWFLEEDGEVKLSRYRASPLPYESSMR